MPGTTSARHRAGRARRRRCAKRTGARAIVAALAWVLLSLLAATALASEPTNAGDNLRDGWYPEQSTLTPQLVSGGTFGQLWSASVEGSVYAQPLLADGEVLVATENNKVYALDPTTGAQKWSTTLNGTAWKSGECSSKRVAQEFGFCARLHLTTGELTGVPSHLAREHSTSWPMNPRI